MANRPIRIEVRGLKELQKKLRFDQTMQEPYRDMLEEAGAAAEGIIRGGAPHGATGQLAAKLTHRLQAIPVPRYVVIKTTAVARGTKGQRKLGSRKSRGGHHWKYPYSYPKRLEFDPKSPHKDWLLGGLKRAAGRVNAVLNGFGRTVEKRWRR